MVAVRPATRQHGGNRRHDQERDLSDETIASEHRRLGKGDVSLFLRRWLANPLQMGSVVPSSRALGQHVARLVERRDDEVVVEIGAGTGAISRALLAAGVPADRLVVVEIVPDMANHLAASLPGVHVVTADAFDLAASLPRWMHGRVGTAICGIPLVLLPLERQRRFVEQVEAVAPGRGFLLYTYCITSPLPWRALGLDAQRKAWTPVNFPPASVWRYRPQAARG
jgi:phosphatidylethanolamine/phosphatidyl-N-methylethanolamine N-methyltransferase